MVIELTEQEVNALLKLMDAGLKNSQSGGLAMAHIAAIIMQKLQNSARTPETNGKSNGHEGEALHG